MGVRRFGLLLPLLLVTATVRAGDHRMDVFLAPSYLEARGSSIKLGGWHSSAAVTLPQHTWCGLIFDMSAHYLGGDGTTPTCNAQPCPQPDRTQLTLMLGPRFTPFKKEHPLHMFFVHAMVFGALHRAGGDQIGGVTSGALALGAGYDLPITKDDTWIPRIQVDYIKAVSSDVQGGVRVSVGLVYRLH